MDSLALFEELRVMAKNGLVDADNPYDRERYERLLELASMGYGEVLERPPAEVHDRLADELGYVTPKTGAKAVVTDDEGRLLVMKRVDDRRWCLPSGYTEPGESPEETAIRETREETGLDVRVADLVGVYYRPPGRYGPHDFVGIAYRCERGGGDLSLSHEGLDLAYRPVEAITDWHADHERVARDALD
ncbi:ADP-ribose pyrophosphatase [Halalkalicoccus paucihalophilus]|uniref:ADP-ribose pyrophosphatase n=1 Tax=Halalkalicoccus paucihalophilus TaxID=1008153 RepID=A0A151AH85_9EURY|nr:NUDIX hydrolase N-terminal domain-containing protein [Halalkalicoccus paucihalophilus]KYH26975.1 ADP-ribose pyrophosphatase [Halalkalicoccus paucihalophilus]